MRAKVFEVILHKLASGESPATVLETQLNGFLENHPQIRVVATHMNSVVAPAQPDSMEGSEEATIIIFYTMLYE